MHIADTEKSVKPDKALKRRIDVIIVNYNSTDFLMDAVRHLYNCGKPYDLHVYVHDNASGDSVQRIRSRFPEIHLSVSKSNLGFAKAVNLLLKKTVAPYVLLMNPDTKMTPGFFEPLMTYMDKHNDVGVLGPKILDEDGTVQGSARSFPTAMTAFFGRKTFLTRWFPNNRITKQNVLTHRTDGKTPIEVEWVSGACLMIRREAFADVGFFDERFFMYWEDADWCKRMWEKNWKVVYYPVSAIYHYVGGSSNKLVIKSHFEFHKSVYRLFKKYYTNLMLPARLLVFLLLASRFFSKVAFYTIEHIYKNVFIHKTGRHKNKKTYGGRHHHHNEKRPVVPDVKVLHIITRLIVGGAQETAILTAEMLKPFFHIQLLTGPQAGPEGSMMDDAAKREIPLAVEPFLVREINPLKDFIAILNIIRFIKKGGYTIVHTHSSKAGIIGRWAAWISGTPVIVHTVHGWGFHEYQPKFVRLMFIFLERLTLTITDKLIAVTERDIQKGLKYNIGKKSRYVIIRSGIETNRFLTPQRNPEDIKKEMGIPLDAPLVGTVTRLSPQKAPLVFIKALGIVAFKSPCAYFVIVGDGPLKKTVENEIQKEGIAGKVVLTGIRNDIPDLMAAFDVFALSSLWEGLPRVIPQAMLNRVPVVVSAVDGNVELIKDYVNGRLVPPNNPEMLAEAIVELIENPELAKEIGLKGMKAAKPFDSKIMGDRTLVLYLELMKNKTPDQNSIPSV